MKHESGFKNTAETGSAENDDLRSLIGQTMSSENDSGMAVSAGKAIKTPKFGKAKVIPLCQEDIELCDGNVKRKRVVVGLAVALSVVLGLIITRSSGVSLKAGPKSQKTESVADRKVVSDSAVTDIWEVPGKISENIRDVTMSSDKQIELTTPAGMPQLPVRGIVVYDNDNKSAIIGDTVAKVGDTVKGVKVNMITADSVVFEKDGVRWIRNIE